MNPIQKKIAEASVKFVYPYMGIIAYRRFVNKIADIYEEEEENKPTNFTCEYKFDKFNKTQFLKIARGEK